MIEDKKLGIKIAESKEERFWTIVKKNAEEEIESCNNSIKLNEKIKWIADQELKKCQTQTTKQE